MRPSPSSALIALALVAGCSGPSAVLHVTPASGITPTVSVTVCPLGTVIDGCSKPVQLFNGESFTRTLAIDDTHGDHAVAVTFDVSVPGALPYCQQIPMLSLAGTPDVVITVDECTLSVAGSLVLSGCQAAGLPVCAAGPDCGPTSTAVFCDGIGGTEKAECCPAGQTCVLMACQ